jgi:hypothetical protein
VNEIKVRAGYGRNNLIFFGAHCVQTISKGGDLWFLVSDLGRMLELTNIRENLRELKDDEKDWCLREPHEPWPTAQDVFAEKGSGIGKTDGKPLETGGQVSQKITPDPLKNRRLRRQEDFLRENFSLRNSIVEKLRQGSPEHPSDYALEEA